MAQSAYDRNMLYGAVTDILGREPQLINNLELDTIKVRQLTVDDQLLMSTDPDGILSQSTKTLISYDTFVADISVTATSFPGTAIVSSTSSTFDGTTPVLIRFWCQRVSVGSAGASTNALKFRLLRDGTEITNPWGIFQTAVGTTIALPCCLELRDTPTAGSHSYSVEAECDLGGSVPWTVGAGAGGAGNKPPGFIRVSYEH